MHTLLAVVSFSLLVSSIAAQEPTSRRGYATTTLRGERQEWRFARFLDGILLENVMVNGKGPFRFLLDTGAEGAGRLDRALVQKLGLAQHGQADTVGVLGETRAMTQYRVESLAVGDLAFTDVAMMSRDYNAEMPRGMRPIDGILGYHLFCEYLLTIDYAARKVVIERGSLPAMDGKNVLAIASDDEDPEIEVTVGGRPTVALLDTGAMGSLAVPLAFAADLKFDGELRVVGRDGEHEVRQGRLDGVLRIGTVEFAAPPTRVAGRLVQTIVGAQLFGAMRVTFDQKNARVRVEPVADRKRYGVVVATDKDGKHSLREVAPGGIAATAGLRGDDTLVAINGKAIAELLREDVLRALDEDAVALVVERDGARQEIRMSLR